jgi:ADP-heptose:LPS heptosyltransferase
MDEAMNTGPTREPLWSAARRVLLVRLDRLGDLLMTTPAFAAVRESLPDAHVALLAAPGVKAVQPHQPMVDEFIGFHAPWVPSGAAALDGDVRLALRPPPGRGEAERQLLQQLLEARFDAAIIFTACTQNSLPAALMCRMAGIPLVLAHTREPAYGLLSDAVLDRDEIGPGMRHEVRRQLDLVAQVGLRTADERLRFLLRERDCSAARAALQAAGVAEDRAYVLVHPGAGAPSRRYPAACYGLAADLMQDDDLAPGPAIVFCGGPGEDVPMHEARAAMRGPSVELPPTLKLGVLAALVAGARVLVANNSAPAHLAAAVGTPVVDLQALSHSQNAPWRVPARVLSCGLPGHQCPQAEPRQVAEAARDLMRLREPA